MVFKRIGSFATRYRYPIIAAWILAAVALTVFAPNLSEVTTSDLSALLPANTPYSDAVDVVETAFPGSGDVGGIVLVVASDTNIINWDTEPFTEQINTVPAAFISDLYAWLTSAEGPNEIGSVTFPISSPEIARMTVDQSDRVAMIPITLSDPNLATNGHFGEFTAQINAWLHDHKPEGINVHITGSTPVIAEFASSAIHTLGRTLIVTLIIVVLLLLIIYRSPVSPLVPLISVTLVYLIARGIIGFLARDLLTVSSYADILLVVVIYGAGTDYCLFLINRFREEVADNPYAIPSAQTTLEKVGETITSSAGTVIVGFTSMIFARFGLFNASGPAIAIGVFICLAAGLTFVPASLAILGNKLFWPGGAKHRPNNKVFEALSAFVIKRPLLVFIGIVLVMAPLAIYGLTVKLNYDMMSELPQNAETRVGFDILQDSLGAGNVAPLTIVVTGRDPASMSAEMARLETDLLALPTIADVMSLNNPTGQSGSMTQLLRADTQLRLFRQLLTSPDLAIQDLDVATINTMLSGIRGYFDKLAVQFPEVADDPNLVMLQSAFGNMLTFGLRQADVPAALEGLAARFDEMDAPYVYIGDLVASLDPSIPQIAQFTQLLNTYISRDSTSYRMTVTLNQSPYLTESLDAVKDIRSILTHYNQQGSAVVDGQAAMFADLRDVLNDDLLLTIGLVSAGIFIVLVLLLRSVIAPLYLLGTVFLSYAFTLGLTKLVFETVFHTDGLSFILPIFTFVFMVALGIDYSIFLLGRVKEEIKTHSIHEGVRRSVITTGPVIAAAGVILAGTFSAMVTGELSALAQLGFAVAVGVLIDTLIVRTLLVASLTVLMGKWAWWPGTLPHEKHVATKHGIPFAVKQLDDASSSD